MSQSTSRQAPAPLRKVCDQLRAKLRSVAGRRNLRSFVIDDDEYQQWLRTYSQVSPEMAAQLAARVAGLPALPLISVIMPSYNVEPAILRAAINSVRQQIYPHWELCISDDASTLEGVRSLLEECAAEDKRIRVTFRATNGHISANSNSALELATGDYVALMDADDLLQPDALFWVAHEIGLNPDVDLIFSDEDKIDATGHRFDPYFKTAWNPALMLAQNAFSHLGVYRRSLVEKVGRFREGYEGAQDHDLVLRCADETTPERIRHIPRILYHWRVLPGSTAASLSAKPYAANAGQLAIEDHLRRRGIKGRVESAAASFYRIAYAPPDPWPLVSIVVSTTAGNRIAARCLRSILDKTRYPNFELILIANGKALAGTRSKFADVLQDPRVRTLPLPPGPLPPGKLAPGPLDLSPANNLGAGEALGELICFLKDDVEAIDPAWLEQLVLRVSIEGVGAAGPMLYHPTDLIENAGILLGVGGVGGAAFRNEERGQTGYFARAALEQDYTALTGVCLLVRRTAFEAIGEFDVTLGDAFSDIDLCIRLRRAGLRVIWTPAAEMIRHESPLLDEDDVSASAGRVELDVNLMRRHWHDILDGDPCYNPNLSLDPQRQFQLSAPPRISFMPNQSQADATKPVSRTGLLP